MAKKKKTTRRRKKAFGLASSLIMFGGASMLLPQTINTVQDGRVSDLPARVRNDISAFGGSAGLERITKAATTLAIGGLVLGIARSVAGRSTVKIGSKRIALLG